MVHKAKVDFLWYKKKQLLNECDECYAKAWSKSGLVECCESKPEEKKEELNLDLNGDGKFDKKDKSIAAKVLASKRPKKK